VCTLHAVQEQGGITAAKPAGSVAGMREGLGAPPPRFHSANDGTLGMVRLLRRGAGGVGGGVSNDPPYFLQHLFASA
jgi:hypothetical protein